MKLFCIELNGLGTHYVVAADPTSAYELIRETFDRNDYGFAKKRSLKSITLVAECGEYPECETRLWLEQSQ